MSHFLETLEMMINQYENDETHLLKCKIELMEQGILDILARVVEMIYYKSVPP
jgi:hypothetical protein